MALGTVRTGRVVEPHIHPRASIPWSGSSFWSVHVGTDAALAVGNGGTVVGHP